ncbi:uncharacterized protein At4g22758 [Selaginella moellendorffii]|nr:uncharacterized protein At4g22758 [Selaginella moellendorffii]|eukprot:XP_002967649.2 uncharacterized protein At4g22758 [Selaginella moellendorffii]
MEQLMPRKLPKSSMSPSSSRSQSTSRCPSKRKKSPPHKDGSSHTPRSSKLPPPRPHHPVHPPYGSSYSWDSAQGQAFMDKVATRTQSAASIHDASQQQQQQRQDGTKDTPYLALVQLFNQFQGMPIDTKKTLVTVTVLGSTGPLRMVVTSDATVKEVMKMALLKYAHEGRVPALGRSTREFELYDSQFSSQALKPDDRIANMGTRNFVLCPVTLKNSCGEESKTSSTSKSWWSYVTGIKSLV